MRQTVCTFSLALLLGGCASSSEERLRDYSEDGLRMYQKGDYAAARESFQAALALKPNDPALLYNLGECCAHLGATDPARQYYDLCLQQAPNHARCRQALARLLVQTGRWQEAARMTEEWMVRAPKASDPYALAGWLQMQAGDLPQAQTRLQQALALDPHNVRALNELGLLYEAMHRPERALVLYERSLEQEPNQPEVLRRLHQLQAQGVGRPKLE
jgi:Flp pilus assembly protein TadD